MTIGTLGILLAGGLGTRLGPGPPKPLRIVAGRTLLDRAISVLEAACDDLVVVAPASLELPVQESLRVDDPPDAAGPLAGLVAGLSARAHTRALVLGVDFPLSRPEALTVIAAPLASGAVAVVPEPGGVLQPLFAAYGTGARALLAERLENGERSVTAAVRALDPVRIPDQDLAGLPGGRENFMNINRPEDLIEAERRLLAPERSKT